jgi:hypothetical protein
MKRTRGITAPVTRMAINVFSDADSDLHATAISGVDTVHSGPCVLNVLQLVEGDRIALYDAGSDADRSSANFIGKLNVADLPGLKGGLSMDLPMANGITIVRYDGHIVRTNVIFTV